MNDTNKTKKDVEFLQWTAKVLRILAWAVLVYQIFYIGSRYMELQNQLAWNSMSTGIDTKSLLEIALDVGVNFWGPILIDLFGAFFKGVVLFVLLRAIAFALEKIAHIVYKLDSDGNSKNFEEINSIKKIGSAAKFRKWFTVIVITTILITIITSIRLIPQTASILNTLFHTGRNSNLFSWIFWVISEIITFAFYFVFYQAFSLILFRLERIENITSMVVAKSQAIHNSTLEMS